LDGTQGNSNLLASSFGTDGTQGNSKLLDGTLDVKEHQDGNEFFELELDFAHLALVPLIKTLEDYFQLVDPALVTEFKSLLKRRRLNDFKVANMKELQEIQRKYGLDESLVWEFRRGLPHPGVWTRPDVIILFGIWLSPKFCVICTEITLKHLVVLCMRKYSVLPSNIASTLERSVVKPLVDTVGQHYSQSGDPTEIIKEDSLACVQPGVSKVTPKPHLSPRNRR